LLVNEITGYIVQPVESVDEAIYLGMQGPFPDVRSRTLKAQMGLTSDEAAHIKPKGFPQGF
jgi:hypothetical protein